ncbi:ABC transporter permease subunit [Burkholderia pseudomultivorans]|uniref:Putrescine transport system permease protein PotH n=1 Tax=Burkholderia pseudomultivorans TaxID=1207504 RepID=A0ABU2E3L0_9BURK|nr:ABC transporter permease subunit [Burkholderia pseudomultivorans]MDR8729633.1 Putrescine transport system permease protein PotH [Burkholderia pseudomultivorans]MDR8737030.1 Putrescine transport system permease protein PotH [Burkholderia pseudomultivorans]MDR8743075.1 Putrescine transport system permease protein PotH [Burkholderia pseudomultivorans]MDR8754450.1 Putrescine transport system permease protein PotH [Burkholderia pseudomultivorans]MDR8779803.1 Putrescine transport system permease 
MSARLFDRARRIAPSGRQLVIAVPFAFLLLFFMLPFLAVVKISFADLRMAMPPYAPLLQWADDVLQLRLNVAHYRSALTDGLYLGAYLKSVEVAFVTTLLCLLIGYPTAYLIARANPARRNLLLVGVMLPFWTSYLIRIYAWVGILKEKGLLNDILLGLHLIDTPLRLYHSNAGLYVGMVYSYLPYLILPLYAHLAKLDLRLLEAARDLGAQPWKVFVTVTLPLSARGIAAGCLLVFIPAVGEYVIPELLGGADALMIGRVMWDDFFNNTDWPAAAAAACAMVALLLVPIAWFQRLRSRETQA